MISTVPEKKGDQSIDDAASTILDYHGLAQHVHEPTRYNPPHLLDAFTTDSNPNSNQVLKINLALKSKSSSVDFIPTSLLKSCSIIFSEIICKLANLSFSSGVYLQIFKTAVVIPLLKKQSLDLSFLPAID